MRRLIVFTVIVLLQTSPLLADVATVGRAYNRMTDLLIIITDLSKEAEKDSDVLRLLNDASKDLDDWQQSKAIEAAHVACAKANQVAGTAPVNYRLKIATEDALNILEPARNSPESANLQKLRDDLRKPTDVAKEIVGGEISELSRILQQLADMDALAAKALSEASAALVGRGERSF